MLSGHHIVWSSGLWCHCLPWWWILSLHNRLGSPQEPCRCRGAFHLMPPCLTRTMPWWPCCGHDRFPLGAAPCPRCYSSWVSNVWPSNQWLHLGAVVWSLECGKSLAIALVLEREMMKPVSIPSAVAVRRSRGSCMVVMKFFPVVCRTTLSTYVEYHQAREV